MARKNQKKAPPALMAAGAQTGHPRRVLKGGKWAAEQFLKALEAGATVLSSSVLRSLDTLRKNEWEHLDDAILEEAVIRLRGVALLRSMGLVIPVPNALGRTMFQWEDMTDLNEAETSLSGVHQTENDAPDFELSQVPLAITHKDFNLNVRALMASRNAPGTEALDSTMARVAGRLVAEKLEKMLFQGGPKFGGATIFGINNAPNKNHQQFSSSGELWDVAAHDGADILLDVLNMLKKLEAARMFGPYALFVCKEFGVKLQDDFKANSDLTIKQRLEQIDGINPSQGGGGVVVADQMTANTVALVQMTRDVIAWVEGEPIQTVQWDAEGGFELNMKVWTIGVPLLRDTAASRSGVCTGSASA